MNLSDDGAIDLDALVTELTKAWDLMRSEQLTIVTVYCHPKDVQYVAPVLSLLGFDGCIRVPVPTPLTFARGQILFMYPEGEVNLQSSSSKSTPTGRSLN